jgi:hypothetical protein
MDLVLSTVKLCFQGANVRKRNVPDVHAGCGNKSLFGVEAAPGHHISTINAVRCCLAEVATEDESGM